MKNISVMAAIAAGADPEKLGVKPIYFVKAGSEKPEVTYIDRWSLVRITVTSSRLIAAEVSRTNGCRPLGAFAAIWANEPRTVLRPKAANGRYSGHTATFVADEFGATLALNKDLAKGEVDVLDAGMTAVMWTNISRRTFAALRLREKRKPYGKAFRTRLRNAETKHKKEGREKALCVAGHRETDLLWSAMTNVKRGGYAFPCDGSKTSPQYREFIIELVDVFRDVDCYGATTQADGRTVSFYAGIGDEEGIVTCWEKTWRFATPEAAKYAAATVNGQY